jgi:hypothetical protein
MIVILMLAATIAQATGGVVLPVYRDLLKPGPFDDAAYADRCGWGAGPLELLKPGTDRATATRWSSRTFVAGR